MKLSKALMVKYSKDEYYGLFSPDGKYYPISFMDHRKWLEKNSSKFSIPELSNDVLNDAYTIGWIRVTYIGFVLSFDYYRDKLDYLKRLVFKTIKNGIEDLEFSIEDFKTSKYIIIPISMTGRPDFNNLDKELWSSYKEN